MILVILGVVGVILLVLVLPPVKLLGGGGEDSGGGAPAKAPEGFEVLSKEFKPSGEESDTRRSRADGRLRSGFPLSRRSEASFP